MQVKPGLKCFVYLQVWHQNIFQNFITSCNFLKYDLQKLLQGSFSIKLPKLCYKSRDEVLVSGPLSVMANFFWEIRRKFLIHQNLISIYNISSRLWSCHLVSSHPQIFFTCKIFTGIISKGHICFVIINSVWKRSIYIIISSKIVTHPIPSPVSVNSFLW